MSDELTIKIPDENSDGYLLREKRRQQLFDDWIAAENGTERVDLLVAFFLDYIGEDSDVEDLEDYLWNAPKSEIQALMDAAGIALVGMQAQDTGSQEQDEVDPKASDS